VPTAVRRERFPGGEGKIWGEEKDGSGSQPHEKKKRGSEKLLDSDLKGLPVLKSNTNRAQEIWGGGRRLGEGKMNGETQAKKSLYVGGLLGSRSGRNNRSSPDLKGGGLLRTGESAERGGLKSQRYGKKIAVHGPQNERRHLAYEDMKRDVREHPDRGREKGRLRLEKRRENGDYHICSGIKRGKGAATRLYGGVLTMKGRPVFLGGAQRKTGEKSTVRQMIGGPSAFRWSGKEETARFLSWGGCRSAIEKKKTRNQSRGGEWRGGTLKKGEKGKIA